MQPHLHISRTSPDSFAYSVSAGGAPACYHENAMGSLESCLDDAGDSLAPYFPTVSVSFEGMFLGCYATHLFQRDPTALALELMSKVLNEYAMLIL
jgi:hypothetical protein